VNINSVVGGGFKDPKTAGDWAAGAELGLRRRSGIIHDGSGQLKPLRPEEARFTRD